jgi:hypothetical protein
VERRWYDGDGESSLVVGRSLEHGTPRRGLSRRGDEGEPDQKPFR